LNNIDIVVVRLKNNGTYGNSKPCAACLNKLNMCAPVKGYRIRRIYYSDENGEIVKSTLEQLLNEPLYVSKGSHYNK
jgi:hypothetical protein